MSKGNRKISIMELYIRTRWNPNSDAGIYWRLWDFERKSMVENEPELLVELDSMGIALSDVKQSVIIWSDKKNYCFFIDNIESNLKDSANRPVKHAFLFVGKYENEAYYRKLLYEYLSSFDFPIKSFYIKEKNIIDFNLSDSLCDSKHANNVWEVSKIRSLNDLKQVIFKNSLPPQNIERKGLLGFLGLKEEYAKEPFLYIREDISEGKVSEIKEKYKHCCVLNFKKGERL